MRSILIDIWVAVCILESIYISDIAEVNKAAGADSEEIMPTTSVNGIKLYYEVHGKGKPFILIQGLGGGHQAWFFQVQALKKHFRVITFDNRGTGRSKQLSGEPYTIKTMADDVIGLMDDLGFDKAHILGLSLGGMIAQEIAISYPHRVDKLILCNTLSGQGTHETAPEMIRNILEAEAAGVDIVAHSREFISSFISLSFNKWCYRMLLKLVIVFSARSTYIRGYFNQMSAVKGHETKSRLHLIHAPTLVMTGTGDKLVEPRFSEMLANGISHARLVKVNGGSHAFFIEMSGRFNREVLDFLTDS